MTRGIVYLPLDSLEIIDDTCNQQRLWSDCTYAQAGLTRLIVGFVVCWFIYNVLISLYSWLSISLPRLSWITAYLEVIISSLLKHENLTTGNKILWKRGEIAPWEQFLLFSTIFSTLNSANLICQDMDISKYFRESLRIRDNESRLYFLCNSQKVIKPHLSGICSIAVTLDAIFYF